MRTTNNMLVNNMLRNIGNNLVRMQKYENQIATGKKISVPSDDPIVATRALKLRTDVAEIDQYKRNAKDALSWLEITESNVGKLNEVMQRVRELLVQGSNGTYSPDDLKKVKEEVKELKSHTVQVANATYAGRYVFSGYKTDKALMDENGNFLIAVNDKERMQYEVGIGDDMNVNVPGGDLFNNGGNANDATSGYAEGIGVVSFPLTVTGGANDTLRLRVDNETVDITLTPGVYSNTGALAMEIENQINTTSTTATDVSVTFENDKMKITSGSVGNSSMIIIVTDPLISTAAAGLGAGAVTQASGTSGGAVGSMMKFFNDVLSAISNGQNDRMGELLKDADREINNMLRVRAEIGGKINRTELTLNRIDADNYNFTKLLSENEDIDMSEAIMNLESEKNVYRASLAGGAKVIQPSLIDFLR